MNTSKYIFTILFIFLFVKIMNAQSFTIRDMGITVNTLTASEQVTQGQNCVYISHDGSTSMTTIYCKYPCTIQQLKSMISSGRIENCQFESDGKYEELALNTFGCFAQTQFGPSCIIGHINPYGLGVIVFSTNFQEPMYGDQRFYWAKEKALQVGNKLSFSPPIKKSTIIVPKPITNNTCYNCNGTGLVKCSNCGGSGSSMEPVFHYGSNYNSYTTYEMRVCMKCISPGKQKCKACNGGK
jgi:hypothetical protein